MSKKSKKETLMAIKFLLLSISAGVIQIVSFTLLNEVAKIKYEWISYLISLVLSVVWNFTFNRKFTFHSANNVPIAMLKVAAFYAVFAPLSTWGTNELNALGLNEYLVEAIFMVLNFVLEYIYDRFFVFGKSIDTDKKKVDSINTQNDDESISNNTEILEQEASASCDIDQEK